MLNAILKLKWISTFLVVMNLFVKPAFSQYEERYLKAECSQNETSEIKIASPILEMHNGKWLCVAKVESTTDIEFTEKWKYTQKKTIHGTISRYPLQAEKNSGCLRPHAFAHRSSDIMEARHSDDATKTWQMKCYYRVCTEDGYSGELSSDLYTVAQVPGGCQFKQGSNTIKVPINGSSVCPNGHCYVDCTVY